MIQELSYNNTIKLKGKILFDPDNKTRKHESQSSWKRTAMIMLEPNLKFDEKGICEYYSWFFKKRFNISLHKPIRNGHITFINDRESDMNGKWEEVKEKWNGVEIEVILNLEPKTDSAEEKSKITYNWWLNIPQENREQIHLIRAELGLGRPFFGLHMTIGRAVDYKSDKPNDNGAQRAKEMNVEQSIYIHKLFKKGLLK